MTMALPKEIGAPVGQSNDECKREVPKTTTDGNPPNPQDAGQGGQFPAPMPPPSRAPFIGTPGPKPMKLK